MNSISWKKRGNLSGLVKQRLYFLFFFGETAKFPALQKVTHNWKFRALPEISHCTIFHRKLRGWLQGGNKPLFSQHSTPIVPQDCAPLVAQRNDLNCTFGFLCWSMFPNIVQRCANIPHLSPYFHTTVPIWQLVLTYRLAERSYWDNSTRYSFWTWCKHECKCDLISSFFVFIFNFSPWPKNWTSDVLWRQIDPHSLVQPIKISCLQASLGEPSTIVFG